MGYRQWMVAVFLLTSGCVVHNYFPGGVEPTREPTAVLRLEPAFGADLGGDEVEIEGQGFREEVDYTVYFGTRQSPSVRVDDDDLLIVTTPRSANCSIRATRPTLVDVRVVGDDGSSTRIPDAFQYIPQTRVATRYDASGRCTTASR